MHVLPVDEGKRTFVLSASVGTVLGGLFWLVFYVVVSIGHIAQ